MILDIEKKIINELGKLGKFPCFVVKHIFLFFILSLVIEFIFAGNLYYQYFVVPQKNILDKNTKIVKFEDKYYKEMIKFWENRQMASNQVLPANILNPFK